METKKLSPAKGLQAIRKENILAIVSAVIAAVSGMLLSVFTLMGVNSNQ